VIGTGGLGHLAVQVLRALTPARVVAVDTRELGRESAVSAGAHEVRDSAAGLRGAALVLDVVGSQETVDAALSAVAPGGDVVVVGSSGGQVLLAKGRGLPQGIRVSLPYWGARSQLESVVRLAAAGQLHVQVERHALADAAEVLERLRGGLVRGRAVLIP
ncbi:MAG: Alcohol dehydrogenase GroES domain protein, partial [Frankiales bacterium]|nr:Alcohol dehydrogenase GroES domain protein [Frankiales bacterium]